MPALLCLRDAELPEAVNEGRHCAENHSGGAPKLVFGGISQSVMSTGFRGFRSKTSSRASVSKRCSSGGGSAVSLI
jgi:hypothetical protein